MGKKNPAVDAYIAKSADFAKPILKHLREAVHAGCPDVEETLKWGFPHFMHKGIVASMASFKAHCAFGFWKGDLLARKHKALSDTRGSAMGEFGRITAVSDLPNRRTLLQYVKDAVEMNDRGIKHPTRAKPKSDRKLTVPDYFRSALKKSKKAMTTFEGFNYSNQKEYVDWVTEAKTVDTRQRRLETAVEWMAEGKPRNWKYMRKMSGTRSSV